MNNINFEQIIREAIEEIRGPIDLNRNSKIITDLRFESIDVIDLFFEIQQKSSIEVDINEIAIKIGGTEGRRFNDMTIGDIISYLELKKNEK